MRARMTVTWVVGAVLAVSGGAVVNAATAGSAPQEPDAGGVIAVEQVSQAAAAVPDEVAANFALFREHGPTQMPPEAALQVGSPGPYGRNADLARAIRTPLGTGWVIPGNGYLCIAVPDPVDGYASSCVRTSVAVRDGLAVRLGGIGAPNSKFGQADGEGRTLDTMLVPDRARAMSGGRALATDAAGVLSELRRDGSPMPTLNRTGG